MAASVAVLAFALVGCGPGDDAGPETGAATPTAPTSSPSPDGGGTSPPVDEPARPAPATGRLIRTDLIALRLPADVRWRSGSDPANAYWFDRDGEMWAVQTSDQLDIGWDFDGLVDVVRSRLKRSDPGVQRLPDRTVDGTPWFTLESVTDGRYLVEVGGVRGDKAVTIAFEFPEKGARATEWIESVLASVRWT